MREDMLDADADPGVGGIAAPDILEHWPALGFAVMETAVPTLGLQPAPVAPAALGGIGSHIGRNVVARYDIAQHAPKIQTDARR